MIAEEFPRAIQAAGIPLYVTFEGTIRSVLTIDKWNFPSSYPTEVLAKVLLGIVDLPWSDPFGCTALGLNDLDSFIVLRSMHAECSWWRSSKFFRPRESPERIRKLRIELMCLAGVEYK